MFTTDWFEVTAIENFKNYVKPLTGEFLEIGCFEGRATCWMLDNTTANVTVVDTFLGNPEFAVLGVDSQGIKQRFLDNIKEHDTALRVTILEGMSQDILKTIKKMFTFIYVDGSHYAGDTMRDMIYSWGLLKTDGIMIIDDYTWGDYEYSQVPKMGIDAFLRCFKGEYEVLVKNSQCVIRKI
jgi:predicted O-methyltransferase YrrM